jgi:hypothetical protein
MVREVNKTFGDLGANLEYAFGVKSSADEWPFRQLAIKCVSSCKHCIAEKRQYLGDGLKD